MIDGPGSASLRDLPDPTHAPDEALLRVRTIGFCGSDMNTYRGLNPLVGYPRVPGHEIAATPADFQSGVDLLRAGGFPTDAAVTRVVQLEDAGEALREWNADPGPVTRIHVNLP